mgnify:CR=1 FL=1
MSHIFLQKDNITNLGDVYEYPINKHDNNNICIETITQKAVQLQIILVVHDWSEWESNWSLQLKDYNTWNTLREFLETIWYDIDFSITNEIEKTKEDLI